MSIFRLRTFHGSIESETLSSGDFIFIFCDKALGGCKFVQSHIITDLDRFYFEIAQS